MIWHNALKGGGETLGKKCDYEKCDYDSERLWELRKDKGLKLEELAAATGISKSALGNYEKDDIKEINHGNLIKLADLYEVSLDYLFCRTENREQINTPLMDLHLNDEMVELLKSGRINNRLLCEFATHKDFIKFVADIEIYVDGIATMQIQNLNTLVDTIRHEIIERHRPGEDDPYLKVLQAAHVTDDEYFSRMVLDDINLIIRDIREAHKKDSESAPQTTVAGELKENLEAVENSKAAVRKKWHCFTVSSSVSITKIFRKKNFAGSFVFSKSQRRWGRRSAREKSGNKNCRCRNWCSCSGSFRFSYSVFGVRHYFFDLSPSFLSPLRAIKPAVTASASIMSCLPNGLAIIKYTRYAVQSNNTARIIPRTTLLFLNIMSSL